MVLSVDAVSCESKVLAPCQQAFAQYVPYHQQLVFSVLHLPQAELTFDVSLNDCSNDSLRSNKAKHGYWTLPDKFQQISTLGKMSFVSVLPQDAHLRSTLEGNGKHPHNIVQVISQSESLSKYYDAYAYHLLLSKTLNVLKLHCLKVFDTYKTTQFNKYHKFF